MKSLVSSHTLIKAKLSSTSQLFKKQRLFLNFSVSTIDILNLGYNANTAVYLLLEFFFFFFEKALELKITICSTFSQLEHVKMFKIVVFKD